MTPPTPTPQELREIATVYHRRAKGSQAARWYEKARQCLLIAQACERWAEQIEAQEINGGSTGVVITDGTNPTHHAG